ncbi:MAG: Stk1 family PASTA domain-containing Ser/Thr kinase [Oscillospiraceae bacterium]|nr:Stk1 family PASTA domain-containing Ser/Thr kinase [Oscillospiraceae bacterium]
MEYIGRTLNGRYQLKKLIGSGGMANVFEAEDLSEGKTVAVKLLKQEYLSNDEFVRRFRNESKVIAVLDHPNIVKVFDVNFTGADQYIVMEYIDGITLNQYIRHQGQLRWKDAVHFVTQILRALQHAHEHGVVHRDIKSQNIMLLRDGSIKVMDFGIARFAREDIRGGQNRAIGSVHYISPEQACGEESDAKSDIYSVGVLLYEMLAGAVPFDGETPEEVAMKHLHNRPVPLQDVNPGVPTGLCEIVEKAMQKDKNLRYRSAREMLAAIEEFKSNPSIVFEYKYMREETQPEEYSQSIRTIRQEDEEEDDEEIVVIKRSPTILILTGIAAACCITALMVLLGFFYWGRDEKVAETPMPNLVGMVYDEIRTQDAYKQFNFVVEERELTDSYPAGQIYYQSVQPGTTVKVNRTIRIKVSDGIVTLVVPDLVGRDVREAEQTLYNMGLDYTIRTQVVEGVPADQVIQTDPPVGTQVEKTTPIVLYISRGQAQVASKVPNVVGRDVEDATARMAAVGLAVTVTEVDSDQEAGIVVEQSLEPNDYVKEGDTVELSVSNGSGFYQQTDVQVDFPIGSASRDYTLVVYIDSVDAGSMTVNPAMTPSVSLSMEGKGLQQVIISMDGRKYAVFNVDFENGEYTLAEGYYEDAIQQGSEDPIDPEGPEGPGEPESGPQYPTGPAPSDPEAPSGPDGAESYS